MQTPKEAHLTLPDTLPAENKNWLLITKRECRKDLENQLKDF